MNISSYFSGDGYQARAMRSTFMVLVSFGGENILRLATNLVLARLLFPEAFGMMALVQVVIAGVTMFSDLGFRGAIVQDPRGDDPAFLNTAWTIQIVRGLLLMVVIMVFAGPAARFYEEPLLGEILMIAAFVPLLKGLESTRVLTADRNMQIERLTFLTLGTQLSGSVATILLAWWMGSVWALAIGLLVAPSLHTALSHSVLHGQPNKLGVDRDAVWSLLRFGGFIFIASGASFFAVHGDRAILGKYVSLTDLAIYNIALLLASVPHKLSSAVATRVIFPLYARRPPAKSEDNRRKINRARMLVTGSLIVMACCLAIIGDFLVRFLYDARYHEAGPYLVLIALASVPQVVVQSYVRLPLASGHSGRFAFFQIATAAFRFGLMLLLVPTFGLLGAIVSLPLTTLLLYPLMIYLILPYRGWHLLHDILFLGIWFVLATAVLCWNWSVITPVFEVVL